MMTSKERLVLSLCVGAFLLVQGVCGFLVARRLKLNSLLWFLLSSLPVIGLFALMTLNAEGTALLKQTEASKAIQIPATQFRMARFRLITGLLLWLFIGPSLLSLLPLPKGLITVLWLIGGGIFLGTYKPRLPDCPRCGKNLGDLFGSYCPECLGSLSPGGTSERNCTTCGKALRNSKGKRGRNFRIRGCSHCGLLLDESGF
jgi:hypothetical protein